MKLRSRYHTSIDEKIKEISVDRVTLREEKWLGKALTFGAVARYFADVHICIVM